ncbi:hypothetical protein [Nocardioides sp. LML1-1-1.1]|uniref:hypothetical protein n=1 Tax=Nocardioides sp. LML1-1-1.1 TaxID=3135248 RepID=UPI00343542D6
MKDWSTRRRAATVSALSLLVMASTSLLGWWWAGSPRADLAQWFAAAATAATLVAAIVAAMFAAGAFSLETAREERYREDQRRHQAERIASWVSLGPLEYGMKHVTSTVTLHVRNATDLPVYEVRVDILLVIRIGGTVLTHDDFRIFPVVPPGPVTTEKRQSMSIRMPDIVLNASTDERRSLIEDSTDEVLVSLSFRDTGNRWWRRTPTGVLEGPFGTKEGLGPR